MFVDRVKFNVKAGKGGDGMVGFRREKYVPNGGPSGGDGGRGGDVVFTVDPGMSTLMDFKYKKLFKAQNGGNGGNKRMTGASADDLIIRVPEGTTIFDTANDKVIADLTKPGDKAVIARGGRGGRGNTHFATAKNSAPEIAENGEPGEELQVNLQLRLLADVGLVAFPSAGKSTLLSTITSSKPKVAEYHFTTLVPNLGIVRNDDGNDFVIADLPGLIEGASQGVGLGFEFLRHIQRTRVILHLVDMSGNEGRDPYDDYVKINKELGDFDESLLKRPQIIVATKMDLPGSEENLEKFKKELKEHDDKIAIKVDAISSVTHQGLDQLIRDTGDLLSKTPQIPFVEEGQLQEDNDGDVLYTAKEEEKPFEIHRDEDGVWMLTGKKIERLFQMTNTDHNQSMMRFARQLRGMGVDDALRAAGAKDGDLVGILDFTFTYMD
ncbi:GTPase ObgE [Fructilactobacillus sanfranciscensis]|uniref:GTPase Obg n=2 Tax=Fructilactobacillus sanfranciscensis TaxID=1625 RepID=G2KWG6_FRUST|nr:GTPase ObgE [Fructilactobacillus sanfranciscensis]AEN99360.1 Spo0B-associated GTP-binding protein [Fructilactobacillus sanfranciscensis TMW 1.1304]MCG7194038.1 GTPase ObgE [Fructilactobacillus sanfranciscensis]MCG7195300.1 GTPase ObgE [Fructilactobacillus sanfranciscensis]MDN4461646.1 GTPase ObgE [Fructilactobacillus sanfranciscensis]MVF15261.1 GTPase ObgE [Fructilactobacillus sanfranciscensis]